MSAFNYVLVEGVCPVCDHRAQVRCQTHVASDYDGNQAGRFHGREYSLGEAMRWWDDSDARYPGWRVDGRETRAAGAEAEYIEEACYATCLSCGAALCAVLRFRKLVPECLLQLTNEEDWPSGYLK